MEPPPPSPLLGYSRAHDKQAVANMQRTQAILDCGLEIQRHVVVHATGGHDDDCHFATVQQLETRRCALHSARRVQAATATISHFGSRSWWYHLSPADRWSKETLLLVLNQHANDSIPELSEPAWIEAFVVTSPPPPCLETTMSGPSEASSSSSSSSSHARSRSQNNQNQWIMEEMIQHGERLLHDFDILLARCKRLDFYKCHDATTIRFFLQPFCHQTALVQEFIQQFPRVLEYEQHQVWSSSTTTRDHLANPEIFKAFCSSKQLPKARLLRGSLQASLRRFAPGMFQNAQLVLFAIGQGLPVFDIIHADLLDHRDFCLQVPQHLVLPIHQGCLRYFSHRLRSDRQVVQAFCQVDGTSLQFAGHDDDHHNATMKMFPLCLDPDLITIAGRADPLAVLSGGPGLAREMLLSDPDMLRTVMDQYRRSCRMGNTRSSNMDDDERLLWDWIDPTLFRHVDMNVAATALVAYCACHCTNPSVGRGSSPDQKGGRHDTDDSSNDTRVSTSSDDDDDDDESISATNTAGPSLMSVPTGSYPPRAIKRFRFDQATMSMAHRLVVDIDPRVWRKAFSIKSSVSLWHLLPPVLQTDISFCWTLIRQQHVVEAGGDNDDDSASSSSPLDAPTIREMQRACPKLKQDRKVWLQLLCGNVFRDLPRHLMEDKDVILHGCSLDPVVLLSVLRTNDAAMLQDRDVVARMLQHKASTWRVLPDTVRSLYPDLMAQAMMVDFTRHAGGGRPSSRSSSGDSYYGPPLPRDVLVHRDVARVWCQWHCHFPSTLQSPADYRMYYNYLQEPSFLLEVLEYNLYWLKHVPASQLLLSNKDFVSNAIEKEPRVLCWAAPSLQQDFELQMAAFSARTDLAYRLMSLSYTKDPVAGFAVVAEFAATVRSMLREYQMVQQVMAAAVVMDDDTTCSTIMRCSSPSNPLQLLNQGPETMRMYQNQLEEHLFGRAMDLDVLWRLVRASTNLLQWGF